MEKPQKMVNKTALLKGTLPEVESVASKARPPFTQNTLDKRMPHKIQAPWISPYYNQANFNNIVDDLKAFINRGSFMDTQRLS